MSAIKNVG